MRVNKILLTSIFALILASCSSVATQPPNVTVTSEVTVTSAPSLTPTLMPESIADAKDLSVWVDEFVHAYGGTVTINGVAVDANQLVTEIKTDPDAFFQTKQINGVEVLFVVVNSVPLAFRGPEGVWQESTMARLSEMSGVTFEFSRSGMPDTHADDYFDVLEKTAGKGSNFTFPSEMDTCRIFNDFSQGDWNKVVTNWDGIKNDLDHGNIPVGFPYQWQGVYNLISFANEHVDNPEFRGQHLVELNLPEYCLLADSIVRAKEVKGFDNAAMLKILEFVVRTRVVKFPEVSKWNAEDEMIAAVSDAKAGGDASKPFWNNVTGLSPAELTTLVSEWIKQDNPNAKVYVVEDVIFENNYAGAQLNIAEFDNYIKALKENNARIDGIISENNFWVFAPPDMGYISKKIAEWDALGFKIGGAETMIITGEKMINDDRRPKTTQVNDQNLAQAEIYRELLSVYLENGITNFGFGGIDDYNAWTNDVGLPDANPLLFDDEFRAKPSYYAIVQVLFEQLK